MNYQQPRKKKMGNQNNINKINSLIGFCSFFSLLRFLTFIRKKIEKIHKSGPYTFHQDSAFPEFGVFDLGFLRPKAENREWQKKKEEEENE